MTTTTTYDEAVDALAPFAELPDWLAALMRPHRLEESLRRHVPELSDGTLTLLSCRADQLRAKDDQWLARCRVTLSPPPPTHPTTGHTDTATDTDSDTTNEGAGAGAGSVADADAGAGEPREIVLVGVLHHPHQPDPDPLPGTGTQTRFGDPGYQIWLPDLRLHLTQEEADPGLPSLGDLTDPHASARLIETMLRQGNHPHAHITTSTPTIARYKPGSRCTIVYDLTYDPPAPTLPNPVIAKTHQGDKGAYAHQAMTALWNTHLSQGEHVLLAEPLGYLPTDRILLQGPVPEDHTLKELCHHAFETTDPHLLDTLRTHLTTTAHALAALHTSGATYPGRVTFADEVAVTRALLGTLSRSIPELASWAEPTMSLLERGDRSVTADAEVSSHNSFSPAQVLLGPGVPAFIDFDSAAMGEPAMDVGRLRAGLRCVGVPALAKHPEGYRADLLQRRLALMDEICDQFLADYQAHAPVTTQRVLLWETLDLLTSMLHTWTKGRLEKVVPRLATLRHQLSHPLLPG
jgi:hypothetical protein